MNHISEDEFMRQYYRLARWRAQDAAGLSEDDKASAAHDGLLHARKKYNANGGKSAANWVVYCVDCFLCRTRTRNNKTKRKISRYTHSMEAIDTSGEDCDRPLAERLPADTPTPLQNFIQSEQISELKTAVQNLQPRDYYILTQYYGLNGIADAKTQREIAETLGVSSSAVSAAIQKIYRKLEKTLKNQEK